MSESPMYSNLLPNDAKFITAKMLFHQDILRMNTLELFDKLLDDFKHNDEHQYFRATNDQYYASLDKSIFAIKT